MAVMKLKSSKLLPKSESNKTVPKEEKRYSNLREIMDRQTPFKIIYSGVENESYYDILYDAGIRNFLMSYHYIQNKHISMSRFEDTNVRLFIDSGAHTYQNDPKYADMSLAYWEEHLKKYLKWVERNKDHIFAIANFDFENLVGAQTVDKWNKEYFEPFMLRTGIPVCFVWHQNSYQTWEYYCKRYPYVGFSSVNTEGVAIDLPEYKEKLRTAERNDSLVHGFGMTRTNMLTELPFYTVDSTTWLVGLQYGEINYWTPSNKMSRLKKDKWKGEYLDDICSKYHLSPDLLLQEDVTELIKANIGAFIDAERFIHTRLKSMMYWMKSRTVKVDVDNLPSDFFPNPDWFTSPNTLEAVSYAKKMNINPELPEQELVNCIWDLTAFLNWDNPEYAEVKGGYTPELISELHDTFINRIVGSDEEKIQDLVGFYRECLSGENDKLLQLGTNFDRVVKEREHYIEDDDEELVDISPDEVKSRLRAILPDSADSENAPEIDALDEEIYRKADIVPVFDENGLFVKGQTAIKRPKKVYSNKFPKFACDTCYAAAKCPEFKAGYVCAYNKMFNRFDTRSMADIIQAVQGIVEHNMARMQRAMIMEVMNGTIDPVTSQLMDTNIRYMQMLKQMYELGSPEVLRQTHIIRADGSEEKTTSITNPQSGGILEKLFSMNVGKATEEERIIDAEEAEIVRTPNERYEVEED